MRLRLLPIVVFAVTALFVLKTGGLFVRGGYLFPPSEAQAQAQGADEAKSGNVAAGREAGAEKPPAGADAERAAPAKTGDRAADTAAEGGDTEGQAGRSVHPGKDIVGAKAAILERLGERRKELDDRARELDLRENLLKAAEKRLEERLKLLQGIEERIMAIEKKHDAEKQAQLKGLVTMYETMKPKDAARIFSQLKTDVLVELVEQMNARKMAEVLANMDDAAAERLTLAIAARGKAKAIPVETAELPKIEGERPN